MRLTTTAVVLTDGETPSLVSCRPCTIHGWRPFSVSTQPAVFIRNGSSDRPDGHPQEPAATSPAACAAATAPTAPTSRTRPPQVGHHPHRPVLDEHVRHVVAGPVLLLVLRLELVEPDHLAVPRVRGQQRQQVRDLDDLRRGLVVVAAADLEQRERARLAGRPTAPRPRRSSSAGTCASVTPELAADEHVEHRAGTSTTRASRAERSKTVGVRAAAQVPGRDAEHDDGRR